MTKKLTVGGVCSGVGGIELGFQQAGFEVRWANEIGIKNIEGNFIVGSHPDETLEDLKLTEKLIRELPLTFVSISVFVSLFTLFVSL